MASGKPKYENSLEFYAIVNKKDYLLKEFSNKNNVIPSELYKRSGKIVLWNCLNCKEEYDMRVSERTRNGRCPFCKSYRTNGTNCIKITHPHIASLLKNKEDALKVTYGSGKSKSFICPDCGHVQNKIIHNVYKRGFSCSKCSDGISYPEKFMMSVLDQLNIFYQFQLSKTSLKWCENYLYDFYIPSLNCIIETHGVQHYIESQRGRTLKEEKVNDKRKYELAMKNGIDHYIIIDCRYSDVDFIKKNLIKSQLNNLIELMDINWVDCEKFAVSSLIKIACDLWKNGMRSSSMIADKLHISKSTSYKYLKHGAKLNWCDYTPTKKNYSDIKRK